MVPAEQADREVVVTMMTPDREGMIRGQVSGATGQPRALVLASPVAESLKVRTAVPDSTTGRFMVAVPAGTYRVGVFRDLDANGVFDPEAHRALAPKDTAQAAGGDTIVVIDSIGAWDRIAVAESIVVPRPEAATITDTTAAVRDTSAAVRDTTGAPGDTTGAPRDSSAVTDSTALAEPLPPDVIEWGEGEIPLEPGEISPYLRLVAPPTGIVPDTSAVPPR
jgi:hypothetical protein